MVETVEILAIMWAGVRILLLIGEAIGGWLERRRDGK